MLFDDREDGAERLYEHAARAGSAVLPLEQYLRFEYRHAAGCLRLLRILREALRVFMKCGRARQFVAGEADDRAPLGKDRSLLLIRGEPLGEVEQTLRDEFLRTIGGFTLSSVEGFGAEVDLHGRGDAARRKRFWK